MLTTLSKTQTIIFEHLIWARLCVGYWWIKQTDYLHSNELYPLEPCALSSEALPVKLI